MKLAEASTQLEELNAKLAVQKVAVTEKTEACEALLAEIAAGTTQAQEKKAMAQQKGKEIEEQSKIISVEKVSESSCSWSLSAATVSRALMLILHFCFLPPR